MVQDIYGILTVSMRYTSVLNMNIKIDGKSILRKHERNKGGKKVSFYLSKTVYEEFKKSCGTAPQSRILEDLMSAFIESLKPDEHRK